MPHSRARGRRKYTNEEIINWSSSSSDGALAWTSATTSSDAEDDRDSDGEKTTEKEAMDYVANALEFAESSESEKGDGLARARAWDEFRLILEMNIDGDERAKGKGKATERRDEGQETPRVKSDDVESAVERMSAALAAAIRAGAELVGFACGKTRGRGEGAIAPPVEVIAALARAHRCALEIRGGGKRRRAIVHCERGARATPNAAEYANAENIMRKMMGKDVKAERERPRDKRTRRVKADVRFVSGGVAGEDVPTITDDDDDETDAEDDDDIVVAEPVKYANRGARRAAEAQARDREYVQKARAKKRGVVVGGGHKFGAFEAHTTGFGSKMLAKMGFQGEGSGVGTPGREGISEPLFAISRAKRVGLGAFGSERVP